MGLWCSTYRPKTAQSSVNVKTSHQFSHWAEAHEEGNSALKRKGERPARNAAHRRAGDGHRATSLRSPARESAAAVAKDPTRALPLVMKRSKSGNYRQVN